MPPIIKFTKKFAVAGGHARVASPALEQKGSAALIDVGETRPWSALKLAARRSGPPQYASALERSLDPMSMHPPIIGHHLSLLERALPKKSESVRELNRAFHNALLPTVQRYFETGASDFSQSFAQMTRALRTLETELIGQLGRLSKTDNDLSRFQESSGHIDGLHQVLGKLAGRNNEVAAAGLGKRLGDAVLSRQLENGARYIAAHAEHFHFDGGGLETAVRALGTASVRTMPARYDDLVTALGDLEYRLVKHTRPAQLSNEEKDALHDVASAFGSIQDGALRLFREAGLKAPVTPAGTKLRAALKAAAT